ncbi:MAG: hypothetical protein F6J92_42150 [Symploca sp. SIO1A3]|nr:hypothetical protein [Symploca sp. SIO1A3]
MTQPKRLLDDMPAPLSAWVGREDLLQALEIFVLRNNSMKLPSSIIKKL